MKNFILPLTLCGLILASCSGNKAHHSPEALFANLPVIAERQISGTDTLIVARLTTMPDPITLHASDFIDSLRLIRLQNTDDAIVGSSIAWNAGNRLFVFDYQLNIVKQFTDDGTYIGNIGARGQGPGEYTIAPYYIDADLAAGRIYLLQYNTDKLISYDLDGNYVADIPLAFTSRKGVFKIDSAKGHITFATLGFTVDAENPVIWTQDFEGNLISRLDRSELKVVPDFSNEIYPSGPANSPDLTFSYWYIAPRADTLYTYLPEANRLTPRFTCDFGSETPIHSLRTFPGFYSIVTTGDAIQAGPSSFIFPSQQPIVIDRTTLRGAPASLLLDQFGLLTMTSDWTDVRTPGYFSLCIDPGDLIDWIDRDLAANPSASTADIARMTDLKASISPDDNAYILLGRWH